jgi:hypothetical protein
MVKKCGTSESLVHINCVALIFNGSQSLSTTLKELLWYGSVACVPAYTSKLQTYPLLASHNSNILIPYLCGFPFM